MGGELFVGGSGREREEEERAAESGRGTEDSRRVGGWEGREVVVGGNVRERKRDV